MHMILNLTSLVLSSVFDLTDEHEPKENKLKEKTSLDDWSVSAQTFLIWIENEEALKLW